MTVPTICPDLNGTLTQCACSIVALARKLRRRRPKGGQLSLRDVSKELAARGFLNELGNAVCREVRSEHVALDGSQKAPAIGME